MVDSPDRDFFQRLSVMRHPLRRKILEHLYGKGRSFTELSEILLRNHGRLGYHLRMMRDIVERDPDRRI